MISNVQTCPRPELAPGVEPESPLARSGRGAGGEGDRHYVADETALVEQPSTIGPRTRLGRFVHVKAGAKVGADCDIGQNAIIASTAVLGDRVRIGPNVVVDDGVILEDDVHCGPGVVLASIVHPRIELLKGGVPRFYPNENGPVPIKPIRVGRGVILCPNATVLGWATIGDHAVIGTGSVVTGYIHPNAVLAGNPATQAGWLYRCATR